tara:strand:+ start:997 stop:2508 length:1512 start_codon:yes stop_codon:yes gene_type:complete
MISLIAKVVAHFRVNKIQKTYSRAIKIQDDTLLRLIKKAINTKFGIDHEFTNISNYEDFKKKVPIRDYESIKHYIKDIQKGKENILWPGKPKYLAKTSGTTSGAKFIPITKESLPFHVNSSRDAILFYIKQTGRSDFLNGKNIFIQGSPVLEEMNGVLIGRLSGIVAHHVPKYLQARNLPTMKTNSIDDWESKIDAICEETFNKDLRVVGGIPSWVQMYFERLLQNKKKEKVIEIFKNLSLFVYGGVNFEPYKRIFLKLIGKEINTIEYYPASEGFFAYQNDQNDPALLLQYNSEIFYEFVELNQFDKKQFRRLNLSQVELNKNYVMIISSNAGLWAYNTGDTIMFKSINPPKIIVTGRYKHYISAFGEHVISSEVEQSIKHAIAKTKLVVKEFTVAPMIDVPKPDLPHHEWWVEFDQSTMVTDEFSKIVDSEMKSQNIYYKDLVDGKVLQPLKVISVPTGSFKNYMKSLGRLGGQNKVPRLSNNRDFVNGLNKYIKKTESKN